MSVEVVGAARQGSDAVETGRLEVIHHRLRVGISRGHHGRDGRPVAGLVGLPAASVAAGHLRLCLGIPALGAGLERCQGVTGTAGDELALLLSQGGVDVELEKAPSSRCRATAASPLRNWQGCTPVLPISEWISPINSRPNFAAKTKRW